MAGQTPAPFHPQTLKACAVARTSRKAHLLRFTIHDRATIAGAHRCRMFSSFQTCKPADSRPMIRRPHSKGDSSSSADSQLSLGGRLDVDALLQLQTIPGHYYYSQEYITKQTPTVK
jgi:hypothetical protein